MCVYSSTSSLSQSPSCVHLCLRRSTAIRPSVACLPSGLFSWTIRASSSFMVGLGRNKRQQPLQSDRNTYYRKLQSRDTARRSQFSLKHEAISTDIRSYFWVSAPPRTMRPPREWHINYPKSTLFTHHFRRSYRRGTRRGSERRLY